MNVMCVGGQKRLFHNHVLISALRRLPREIERATLLYSLSLVAFKTAFSNFLDWVYIQRSRCASSTNSIFALGVNAELSIMWLPAFARYSGRESFLRDRARLRVCERH